MVEIRTLRDGGWVTLKLLESPECLVQTLQIPTSFLKAPVLDALECRPTLYFKPNVLLSLGMLTFIKHNFTTTVCLYLSCWDSVVAAN